MGFESTIKLGLAAATLAAALIYGALGAPASASHMEELTSPDVRSMSRLVMPIMNAARGKALFVNKGCVACHSINGVGGHDAPAMDAHTRMDLVNPFDFAARMWNHAPAMIAAQEEAFGEQVYFTGQELMDIIGFVHDDEAQHGFNESDLTTEARKMMDHGHGEMAAPKAHAKEVGHNHGDTPPHKD